MTIAYYVKIAKEHFNVLAQEYIWVIDQACSVKMAGFKCQVHFLLILCNRTSSILPARVANHSARSREVHFSRVLKNSRVLIYLNNALGCVFYFFNTASRLDLPGQANHVIRPKTTRFSNLATLGINKSGKLCHPSWSRDRYTEEDL